LPLKKDPAKLDLNFTEDLCREDAEGPDAWLRSRYGPEVDARPKEFVRLVENDPRGVVVEVEVALDLWWDRDAAGRFGR
jgi:hypothetical protein